eukprot:3937990-Rhodomonas_salina.1
MEEAEGGRAGGKECEGKNASPVANASEVWEHEREVSLTLKLLQSRLAAPLQMSGPAISHRTESDGKADQVESNDKAFRSRKKLAV